MFVIPAQAGIQKITTTIFCFCPWPRPAGRLDSRFHGNDKGLIKNRGALVVRAPGMTSILIGFNLAD